MLLRNKYICLFQCNNAPLHVIRLVFSGQMEYHKVSDLAFCACACIFLNAPAKWLGMDHLLPHIGRLMALRVSNFFLQTVHSVHRHNCCYTKVCNV